MQGPLLSRAAGWFDIIFFLSQAGQMLVQVDTHAPREVDKVHLPASSERVSGSSSRMNTMCFVPASEVGNDSRPVY